MQIRAIVGLGRLDNHSAWPFSGTIHSAGRFHVTVPINLINLIRTHIKCSSCPIRPRSEIRIPRELTGILIRPDPAHRAAVLSN